MQDTSARRRPPTRCGPRHASCRSPPAAAHCWLSTNLPAASHAGSSLPAGCPVRIQPHAITFMNSGSPPACSTASHPLALTLPCRVLAGTAGARHHHPTPTLLQRKDAQDAIVVHGFNTTLVPDPRVSACTCGGALQPVVLLPQLQAAPWATTSRHNTPLPQVDGCNAHPRALCCR